jgi:hypothetical protein
LVAEEQARFWSRKIRDRFALVMVLRAKRSHRLLREVVPPVLILRHAFLMTAGGFYKLLKMG